MKQLKNLGNTLSKKEQKYITGGNFIGLIPKCDTDSDCTEGVCAFGTCCTYC